MTILFIIAILLKNLMIDFIVKSMDEKKKEEVEGEKEGNEDFEMRSQRTLTKSYKLEKNPDYFEILAIMKMM